MLIKKYIAIIVVNLIVLLGSFFLVIINADKLVNHYSHQIVKILNERAVRHGARIKNFSYTDVHFTSLNTITWRNINAKVTLPHPSEILAINNLQVNANLLSMQISGFIMPEFSFAVTGMNVTGAVTQGDLQNSSTHQAENLAVSQASIRFRLDLFSKKTISAQLRDIAHNIYDITDSGQTLYPITLKAVGSFNVRDERVKALLTVKRQGSEYLIILNKESLKIISWLFEEPLTEPEINILSKNPFRAPRLLKIKDEAQKISHKAHSMNDTVPEDAYRHILWSYLLTRQYGTDFAQQVTDAHEQGNTDNSAAEHRMDYTNNRIGRRYASQKYGKEDILFQLLRDSEVVRNATGGH
jgi:hypothetical protein